jgi:hypothetical protein
MAQASPVGLGAQGPTSVRRSPPPSELYRRLVRLTRQLVEASLTFRRASSWLEHYCVLRRLSGRVFLHLRLAWIKCWAP